MKSRVVLLSIRLALRVLFSTWMLNFMVLVCWADARPGRSAS